MRAKTLLRRPILVAGAFLLTVGIADGAPARKSGSRPTPAIDSEFRAAYPMSAAPTRPLAGVALDKLHLAGLQLAARSDDLPDDGGIALSFADSAGVVRVLVRVAVCADATAARKVLETELRGVSTQLNRASDATLGDNAFTDDAGKGAGLIFATQGNIAYAVDVVRPAAGLPSAVDIASQLRAAMVAGVLAFPAATLSLPSTIDAKRGGDVRIEVPGRHPYKLRAENGYIARGQNGPIVRPFAPGPVTIHATIVDNLGRVTLTSSTTRAQ